MSSVNIEFSLTMPTNHLVRSLVVSSKLWPLRLQLKFAPRTFARASVRSSHGQQTASFVSLFVRDIFFRLAAGFCFLSTHSRNTEKVGNHVIQLFCSELGSIIWRHQDS